MDAQEGWRAWMLSVWVRQPDQMFEHAERKWYAPESSQTHTKSRVCPADEVAAD